jgi:hypothetical protein
VVYAYEAAEGMLCHQGGTHTYFVPASGGRKRRSYRAVARLRSRGSGLAYSSAMARYTPRTVAVLAGAALVLHELRFLLAPDPHAAEAGHAYLAVVAPVVAALLTAACGAFCLAVVRGSGPRSHAAPPFARLWLAASAALAATYSIQELLEGMLAAGHPAGLAAVVAHGGWIGLVLAFVLGALVALGLRGAHAILARPRGALPRRRELPPRPLRPTMVAGSSLDVVARHLAGRGPPFASPSR